MGGTPRWGSSTRRQAFDPVGGICEVGLTHWPKGREPVTVEYRLRVYTAGELKRLAREAGFAEVELRRPRRGPGLAGYPPHSRRQETVTDVEFRFLMREGRSHIRWLASTLPNGD